MCICVFVYVVYGMVCLCVVFVIYMCLCGEACGMCHVCMGFSVLGKLLYVHVWCVVYVFVW